MFVEEIEDNDYTFDDEHPDFEAECDHCAEPSADLEYFESADESVGYRDGQYLCPKCRPRRKP